MQSYRRSRNDGPVLPTTNGHSERRGRQPAQEDQDTMAFKVRGHFVAMTGEFVGTLLFLWFALSGTQIANTVIPPSSNGDVTGQLFLISVSFGFSLMIAVWVFYRISGGLFNPAV